MAHEHDISSMEIDKHRASKTTENAENIQELTNINFQTNQTSIIILSRKLYIPQSWREKKIKKPLVLNQDKKFLMKFQTYQRNTFISTQIYFLDKHWISPKQVLTMWNNARINISNYNSKVLINHISNNFLLITV